MEATTLRPIVLVPGALLGGWVWREVAAALRSRGHDVYPVTLTGLGERAHLATPEVDLETHIADVLGVLDYEDLHDAMLVGHSYSGVVVTGAADRRPQRLDAVVYFDCSPMPDGMSIADVQPPSMRERQEHDVNERGDGWRWPAPDRDTLVSGMFGSTVGMTDEQIDLLLERARPQPYKTFTQELRLAHIEPPGVRRAAIFCTAGGVSIALLQQLLEQGDPRAAMFAGPGWDLYEMPTGHWAMLSEPAESAELLARIASD
jgi:pimeloyl-ACP methyl ester carboxylesterase